MKTKYSKISLLFLLIIAIIGTLLRGQMFKSIPVKYTNFLHAHSHVAFQGWLYTILFLLVTSTYLKESQIIKGRYDLQFKLSVATVISILITFAYQGYGVFSIVCSTLFQILNYWFVRRFLRDTKNQKRKGLTDSIRFVRTGLKFGILSTLIPLVIGIISAQGLIGSELYRTFVYIFLHLQYNGWFLFLVLGLFFNNLEKNNIAISPKFVGYFYWISTLNVIPSISLSLVGMSYYPNIKLIGYFSSSLLIMSIVHFTRSFSIRSLLKQGCKSSWSKTFLLVFIASFILKSILQSISISNSLLDLSFHNRWIIIAYLHLTMIGTFSFFLIYSMLERSLIKLILLSKIGLTMLLIGFISSECLMINIGLTGSNLHISLLISSVMMAIGVLLLLLTPTENGNSSLTSFINK